MNEVFKALGNSMRLQLYTALLEDELCVCELTDLFDISQPAISQHLKQLQKVNLVESEKRGEWTFYQARANPLEEVCEMVLEQDEDYWLQLRENIVSVKRDKTCSERYSEKNSPRKTLSNVG